MGRTLTWLHLSDWHQRGPDFERRAVRDALRKDILSRVEIDQRLEQIDFVVLSGDLAFSGQSSEYETAEKEFLDPVLHAVSAPRERLFMVPGNHDLSRDVLPLFGRWLDLFPSLKEVNAALIDPNKRDTLLRPMENYNRFVHAFYGIRLDKSPAYEFLFPFEVRGIRIALVGMNTAWLCGQRIEHGEVNDYGVLALGEPQLHEAMEDLAFQQADVRLGVLHHPFSWLGARFDRSRIEQTLTRGFHFLLRGHEHEARAAIPNGTDGNCAIISAGAAYDRRDGKMNGYNFVHLDFDNGRGTVFLRRYDINSGFLKDTVTTGDTTPGYHRFRLPRKLGSRARGEARQRATRIIAERVRDHRSLDVLAAIEIYAARIPLSEQVAPDFIRWLREDEERVANGHLSRDFLFVAKLRDEVCGLALLHSNPERKLAFIAYLVAIQGVKDEQRTISAVLLEEVAKLFAQGGALTDYRGILLEVEDPRTAASPSPQHERLARIRLFCTLATREGFVLRALDFSYLQPVLYVPKLGEQGREIPLVLMFAQPRQTRIERYLDREKVRELLDFMYMWLYPEGFSESEEATAEYRRYVDQLHSRVSEALPEKVPAVDIGEIQSWCGDRFAEPLNPVKEVGAQ
jgi:predicted phosphodiesterase